MFDEPWISEDTDRFINSLIGGMAVFFITILITTLDLVGPNVTLALGLLSGSPIWFQFLRRMALSLNIIDNDVTFRGSIFSLFVVSFIILVVANVFQGIEPFAVPFLIVPQVIAFAVFLVAVLTYKWVNTVQEVVSLKYHYRAPIIISVVTFVPFLVLVMVETLFQSEILSGLV